ncbi:LppP/LprE family lipoprotein [Corynebacterium sp. H78]|uniref:LppP/LprE family lipoprotein n=1 Tax=Corynebacterium sp. H78 TaxID=3133417 RepID=UPI0030AD4AF0
MPIYDRPDTPIFPISLARSFATGFVALGLGIASGSLATAAPTVSPDAPAPTEAARSTQECGTLPGEVALSQAIDSAKSHGHISDAETWVEDTYLSAPHNPCADLSAKVITVEGGTGSSPQAVLFFHKGEYVDVAPVPAGFHAASEWGTRTGNVAKAFPNGSNEFEVHWTHPQKKDLPFWYTYRDGMILVS